MARQGNLRAALDKQEQAVTWLRTLLDADPRNDRARFDAARALSEAGETLVTLRERSRAQAYLTESLQILFASAGGKAPQLTVERSLMAFTYFQLIRLSVQDSKQCGQAQAWFERAAPLLTASEQSRTWHLYVAGMSAEAKRLLAACPRGD
jgi:hypothetical protein